MHYIEMETMEATSFFWKQSRAKTFSNWPFQPSDKCNPDGMAAAGFYVIGDDNEPDLVECFTCGKQLDGWEKDDDPWSEHVKHQPSCPFVKLNKTNEKDWTVDELYDLYKKFKLREYMHELNKSITAMKEKEAQLKDDLSSMYKTSRRTKKSVS